MDRLKAMETFVRVVETGSFSAVARESGQTQGAVSKQVAALEEHLATRLLSRSTRALALTEAGAAYYDRIRPLVSDLHEADSAVQGADQLLRGQLRVAASVAFGRRHLLPQVMAFRQAHPGVQVDLKLNDNFIDLIERGVDVAIRIGDLPDSALVARAILTGRRCLLAGRDWLARNGTPDHAAAIDPRDCVVYTERPDPFLWLLPPTTPGGPPDSLRMAGAMTTNSSEIVQNFVAGQHGIGFAPTFLFQEELAAGTVCALWPGRDWPAVPVYAVCPPARRQARRVQAFIAHLQAGLVPVAQPSAAG